MIAEKMRPLVENNSAIRAMFEEGKRLAAIYGPENVYDFSLGNPNVPAPEAVNRAITDIVAEEASTKVHGYMSNAGFEDVRDTVAQSLNRRFGTQFHLENILMTVGAASGMNVILKTVLDPGDEVIVFGPLFYGVRRLCEKLRRSAGDGVPGYLLISAEYLGAEGEDYETDEGGHHQYAGTIPPEWSIRRRRWNRLRQL